MPLVYQHLHNDPKNALSDGAQSLTPEQFVAIMNKIKAYAEFCGRKLGA